MTDSAPQTRTLALQAKGLQRVFVDGKRRLEVLKGADLSVAPGEVMALVGRSGSGKSTLLHLLGLLDQPDGGEVLVDGTPTANMRENDRAELRSRHIGFVFQHYFLMSDFSTLDNVLMPARVAHSPGAWLAGGSAKATARAWQLLEQVGLKDQARQKPATLSGGERQRAAICRALMLQPRVLLCDEPTGNLDPDTASRIMKLIFELTHKDGVATVVVSHDVTLAERADRVLRLEQGILQLETK
ncbi:MAG: ABC transporter ATP-binding protein [Planctomycetes bacterium]|nr:ABC transporter ATP-binding protein [Planctomycetota bacterium]